MAAALPDPVPSRVPGTRCPPIGVLLPVGNDLVPARAASRVVRCSFLVAAAVGVTAITLLLFRSIVVVVDPPQVEQRQAGAADRTHALGGNSGNRHIGRDPSMLLLLVVQQDRAVVVRGRLKLPRLPYQAERVLCRGGRGRPPPRECRRRREELLPPPPRRRCASARLCPSTALQIPGEQYLPRIRSLRVSPPVVFFSDSGGDRSGPTRPRLCTGRSVRCLHALLHRLQRKWDTTASIALVPRLLVSLTTLALALSAAGAGCENNS
jgi:hypothetical protein